VTLRSARRIILILLASGGGASALAQGSGQVAGTQCWINGELQGGFPAGYSCPANTRAAGGGYILGPPIIIWRRPSAAGSQMPGLSPANGALAAGLNAAADTSLTLMQKGEFAMKNGDLPAAKRYFDQASQRDPNNPEILKDIVILQQMFDRGAGLNVQPYQMLDTPLSPMSPTIVDRYAGNGLVQPLRIAELQAYRNLAQANEAFQAVSARAAQGAASPQEVSAARAQLDQAAEAFEATQARLKSQIAALGG
jgi:tetratricopeptide (TPR) repeat protein